jgi:hypothetical protein
MTKSQGILSALRSDAQGVLTEIMLGLRDAEKGLKERPADGLFYEKNSA